MLPYHLLMQYMINRPMKYQPNVHTMIQMLHTMAYHSYPTFQDYT
nr:MAG TPA: hypothetical protein [Bacteriophage sp.]